MALRCFMYSGIPLLSFYVLGIGLETGEQRCREGNGQKRRSKREKRNERKTGDKRQKMTDQNGMKKGQTSHILRSGSNGPFTDFQ